MSVTDLLAPPPLSDASWDVVVVGCGYAGAVAAIAAHDAGARVVVVEKQAAPGGISICSAGGVRIAFDAKLALEYLEATNGDTTPRAVLKTLAEGMTTLPAYIEDLAVASRARVGLRKAPGNYPLPGGDAFGFVTIDEAPGFDPGIEYPHVKGSPAGARLFKVVHDNLMRRGIPVRTRWAARRLLRDAAGKVCGIDAGAGDSLEARAVVLACGGFEGSPELQRQFWPEKPVLSAAFRGNTGDGIRMAQSVGASLWHMWHYHGSYGFRHPDASYPFGIRTKRLPDWVPGGTERSDVRMPWILLDRGGRRFMNEYEPYLQDTGHRPLARFAPESQDFPRLPAWFVADEVGRKLYPFGRPTYNEPGLELDWSDDNLAEVEAGILKKAKDVEELARGLSLPVERVERTLSRWNRSCEDAVDAELGRPGSSMMAIRTAPFYYAPMWPIVSNTQGGPVHDECQRVLDAYGEPIPGLYAAGELGSVFGHLYLSGGNLAECFVGGRIAGREAAQTV